MTDRLQDSEVSTEMPFGREADALALGRAPDAAAPAVAQKKIGKHTPDSSYQNYLFGKSGQEDRPAWSDSIKGRAGIRLVSRGIVGAAFFTIGGRMARHQLEYYNPEGAPENLLQAVAKGIDLTFGRGFKKIIKTAAELVGHENPAQMAEETMLFRRSRDFIKFSEQGKPIELGEGIFEQRDGKTVYERVGDEIREKKKLDKKPGRSYGSEVVHFTFDFACASVGDATTRNLFQVFDPNVKKSWLLNDEGKPATHGERTHIDWGKWAKATASTTWRIFSKNQGEDWAAAIPYAFQMKFQSKFLNSAFMGKRRSDGLNRFEGHELVFDQGWNGGAYLRNKEGQIVGDYQLAGAIDLHARFVGYNWYTLMFREAYDRIGHTLTEWKNDGFAIHAPHLPEHFNPITASVDAVATSARYLTKSFIKANMYMNPAVVPFWFLRVSQSKWRGSRYVEPKRDNLGNVMLTPEDQEIMGLGKETDIFKRPIDGQPDTRLDPYGSINYTHYPNDTLAEKFETGFSKILNKVGAGQYAVGNKAGNYVVEKNLLPKWKWLRDLVQFDVRTSTDRAQLAPERILLKGTKNFIHEYTDAAFSYTPYMFAKAEFGLRVDDSKGDGKPGKMDKAIYRFMDNVGSFNLQGSWQSMKEMWKLGTRFEHEVKMREGGGVTVEEPAAIKTQTMASTTAGTPTNTVAAGDVQRMPANFQRHAANDGQYRLAM